jgi:hypothetical protein
MVGRPCRRKDDHANMATLPLLSTPSPKEEEEERVRYRNGEELDMRLEDSGSLRRRGRAIPNFLMNDGASNWGAGGSVGSGLRCKVLIGPPPGRYFFSIRHSTVDILVVLLMFEPCTLSTSSHYRMKYSSPSVL